MNQSRPCAPAQADHPIFALRACYDALGIDGFIVPRGDEFLGEYVPASAERLAWVTGFTGSAGTAIIMRDRAALFVDGRYTLQAANEVDEAVVTIVPLAERSPDAWLGAELKAGQVLGYDPRLHSDAAVKRLRESVSRAGGQLQDIKSNPVDSVWTDRPPAPQAPAVPHTQDFAGRTSEEKRQDLAAQLKQQGCGAAVIASPDSVAWLLNIRGGDLEYSPIALGHAILNDDASAILFMDPAKSSSGLVEHLGNAVSLQPLSDFGDGLARLGGKKVSVDSASTAHWVVDQLVSAGATIVNGADPCALPKAIKNDVELSGTRAAHRRDGAALTRFLHWIAVNAPAGGVTELSASDRLESLRREDPLCHGLSFPTIAGFGPNGAIVHYRVTADSSRALTPSALFLVDSGGQYPDGTTDVTRTMVIGVPTHEMRDRFTRVLKGHIALATAVFPEGTTGSQLDLLARQALWEAGVDYDHGTGHGVGSFLNVHEGPHRISKAGGGVPLQAGMIVSNEPGYYKTDAYGIRIENLVAVEKRPTPEGGDRSLLGFETLTRAPIDRALVLPTRLTDHERAWLNGYHEAVREDLKPLLDDTVGGWLEDVTRPV